MSVSVPRDVSEWSSKPVPFSKKKSGTRAVFYEDNSVVQRRLPRNDWGGCVCYTEHPLPLGQVWQITVHKDRIIWAFEIGMVRKNVTTTCKSQSMSTASLVLQIVIR